MAAQLMTTNGLSRRGLSACKARATSSLPVPVSPVQKDGGLPRGHQPGQTVYPA